MKDPSAPAPKSLAELLGEPPAPAAAAPLTGKAFAEAVLNSEEFRQYITQGLDDRTLPSAVVTKLMDYGWGKPPDRMEVAGKDGGPIRITRIEHVIVDPLVSDDDSDGHSLTH